jgi:hypothetical protein
MQLQLPGSRLVLLSAALLSAKRIRIVSYEGRARTQVCTCALCVRCSVRENPALCLEMETGELAELQSSFA